MKNKILIFFLWLGIIEPVFTQNIFAPYENDENTVLLMHFENNLQNASLLSDDGIIQGNKSISYLSSLKSELGNCIYFNNTSDQNYITIPETNNLNLTNDWTIEFWFKIKSWANSHNSWPVPICKPAQTGWDVNYDIEISSQDKKLFIQYYTENSSSTEINTPANTIETGIWYHISFIRNTSKQKIFLHLTDHDGYEIINDSLAYASTQAPVSSNNPLKIGLGMAGDNYFDGYMDELRISNCDRSLETGTNAGEATEHFIFENFTQEQIDELSPFINNTYDTITTYLKGSACFGTNNFADKIRLIYLTPSEFTTQFTSLPSWKAGVVSGGKLYVTDLNNTQQTNYYKTFQNVLTHTFTEFCSQNVFGGYGKIWFPYGLARWFCKLEPTRQDIVSYVNNNGKPVGDFYTNEENFGASIEKDFAYIVVQTCLFRRGYWGLCGFMHYTEDIQNLTHRYLDYYYLNEDPDRMKLQRETTHFKIYMTDQSVGCINKVAEKLEEKYTQYSDSFNINIIPKTTLLVYPDITTYTYQKGEDEVNNCSVGEGLGAYHLSCVSPLNPGPCSSEDEVINGIIPHEYAHTIQFIFKTTYLHGLLSEGFACAVPQGVLSEQYIQTIKQDIHNRFTNMANGIGHFPTINEMFEHSESYDMIYAGGEVFVDYMLKEYGYSLFKKFIESIPVNDARNYLIYDYSQFGISREEFESRWYEYLYTNFELGTNINNKLFETSNIEWYGTQSSATVLSSVSTDVDKRLNFFKKMDFLSIQNKLKIKYVSDITSIAGSENLKSWECAFYNFTTDTLYISTPDGSNNMFPDLKSVCYYGIGQYTLIKRYGENNYADWLKYGFPLWESGYIPARNVMVQNVNTEGYPGIETISNASFNEQTNFSFATAAMQYFIQHYGYRCFLEYGYSYNTTSGNQFNLDKVNSVTVANQVYKIFLDLFYLQENHITKRDETENVIYYFANSDMGLYDEYKSFFEETFKKFITDFSVTFDRKVNFIVYPEFCSYHEISGYECDPDSWSIGGGIENILFRMISPNATDKNNNPSSLIKHEFSHVMCDQMGRLYPAFFNEGFATYMGDAYAQEQYLSLYSGSLQSAVDNMLEKVGRWATFDELARYDFNWQYNIDYYRIGMYMIDYLMRKFQHEGIIKLTSVNGIDMSILGYNSKENYMECYRHYLYDRYLTDGLIQINTNINEYNLSAGSTIPLNVTIDSKISQVNIYYSTDQGKTWELYQSNLPVQSSYDFIIPSVQTNELSIKIEDAMENLVYGTTGIQPSIITSVSDLNLGNVEIGNNNVQNFTIKAEYLKDDITITAPAGFELSLTGTYYSSTPISLKLFNDNIFPVKIWVRFSPTAEQTYSGQISLTSANINTVNINVSGTGVAVGTAVISVTTSNLSFENIEVGSISVEQSYTVSGNNLSSDILITTPEHFEISLDNIDYSLNPITLNPTSGKVNETKIYVRFVSSSTNECSGEIRHTSTGASDVNVSLIGYSTCDDFYVDGSGNKSICLNSDVTLSATPSKTGQFNFQWKKDDQPLNNGSNYTGVTTADLSILNIDYENEGAYTCDVTDVCENTRTSPQATITVQALTEITSHPQNINTDEGKEAIFMVIANGSELNYQWRFNETEIYGGDSPEYIIPSVSNNNTGEYDVVVSGACGEVTSNKACLSLKTAIENLKYYGINVYPNPSFGIFKITCPEQKKVNVSILNVDGEFVYHQKLSNNINTIDLTNITKGIYIIKFDFEDKTLNSRIVLY